MKQVNDALVIDRDMSITDFVKLLQEQIESLEKSIKIDSINESLCTMKNALRFLKNVNAKVNDENSGLQKEIMVIRCKL